MSSIPKRYKTAPSAADDRVAVQRGSALDEPIPPTKVANFPAAILIVSIEKKYSPRTRLRAQSKDFLIKDSDLCELGVSAVNRAAAWLQHERLRTQSGWLHLCVVKSPVILIDEFNQSLDGLQFWIHGDFGKIEILGHEKFKAVRGSTRDAIQRCS